MTAGNIASIAVLAIVILVFVWILLKFRKPDITKLYVSKPLLTERESKFYRKLLPVANKAGLTVCMKVRLADLIEPKPKDENPMWMECFNKIKSKHIDFVLINKNAEPVFLIELDDKTHSRPDRIERDDFVNAVLKNTGYVLLRTYGDITIIENAIS